MSSNGIPSEVRNFLTRHVRSVGHLEVLLLMASQPDRVWGAEELSRELRTNPTYADAQLKNLGDSGAVIRTSGETNQFQISGAPDVRGAMEWLKQNFSQRRSSVINIIYSQPIEKIRDLADAFVFGKE